MLSLDARGHGFTTPDPIPQPRPPNHALPDLSTTGNPASNIPSTNDEITTSAEQEGGNLDLRLETLSADVVAVVELTNQKMAWTELPGLILVGHSLGGAVMTDVAMGGKLGNKVLGYAVLDVVEGMCAPRYAITSVIRSPSSRLIQKKRANSLQMQVPPSTPYKACNPTYPHDRRLFQL